MRQGTISEAQRQVLSAELAGRLEQWLLAPSCCWRYCRVTSCAFECVLLAVAVSTGAYPPRWCSSPELLLVHSKEQQVESVFRHGRRQLTLMGAVMESGQHPLFFPKHMISIVSFVSAIHKIAHWIGCTCF